MDQAPCWAKLQVAHMKLHVELTKPQTGEKSLLLGIKTSPVLQRRSVGLDRRGPLMWKKKKPRLPWRKPQVRQKKPFVGPEKAPMILSVLNSFVLRVWSFCYGYLLWFSEKINVVIGRKKIWIFVETHLFISFQHLDCKLTSKHRKHNKCESVTFRWVCNEMLCKLQFLQQSLIGLIF